MMILEDILHIAGWLAGHRDPRIQAIRPGGGNEPVPGATLLHPSDSLAAYMIQDRGYRMQDTG